MDTAPVVQQQPSRGHFRLLRHLQPEDLPEGWRDRETLDVIRHVGQRVVKIYIPRMSRQRPANIYSDQQDYGGTGFAYYVSRDIVKIRTSMHVLYNEEEARSATVEFSLHVPGTDTPEAVHLAGTAHDFYSCASEDYASFTCFSTSHFPEHLHLFRDVPVLDNKGCEDRSGVPDRVNSEGTVDAEEGVYCQRSVSISQRYNIEVPESDATASEHRRELGARRIRASTELEAGDFVAILGYPNGGEKSFSVGPAVIRRQYISDFNDSGSVVVSDNTHDLASKDTRNYDEDFNMKMDMSSNSSPEVRSTGKQNTDQNALRSLGKEFTSRRDRTYHTRTTLGCSGAPVILLKRSMRAPVVDNSQHSGTCYFKNGASLGFATCFSPIKVSRPARASRQMSAWSVDVIYEKQLIQDHTADDRMTVVVDEIRGAMSWVPRAEEVPMTRPGSRGRSQLPRVFSNLPNIGHLRPARVACGRSTDPVRTPSSTEIRNTSHLSETTEEMTTFAWRDSRPNLDGSCENAPARKTLFFVDVCHKEKTGITRSVLHRLAAQSLSHCGAGGEYCALEGGTGQSRPSQRPRFQNPLQNAPARFQNVNRTLRNAEEAVRNFANMNLKTSDTSNKTDAADKVSRKRDRDEVVGGNGGHSSSPVTRVEVEDCVRVSLSMTDVSKPRQTLDNYHASRSLTDPREGMRPKEGVPSSEGKARRSLFAKSNLALTIRTRKIGTACSDASPSVSSSSCENPWTGSSASGPSSPCSLDDEFPKLVGQRHSSPLPILRKDCHLLHVRSDSKVRNPSPAALSDVDNSSSSPASQESALNIDDWPVLSMSLDASQEPDACTEISASSVASKQNSSSRLSSVASTQNSSSRASSVAHDADTESLEMSTGSESLCYASVLKSTPQSKTTVSRNTGIADIKEWAASLWKTQLRSPKMEVLQRDAQRSSQGRTVGATQGKKKPNFARSRNPNRWGVASSRTPCPARSRNPQEDFLSGSDDCEWPPLSDLNTTGTSNKVDITTKTPSKWRRDDLSEGDSGHSSCPGNRVEVEDCVREDLSRTDVSKPRHTLSNHHPSVVKDSHQQLKHGYNHWLQTATVTGSDEKPLPDENLSSLSENTPSTTKASTSSSPYSASRNVAHSEGEGKNEIFVFPSIHDQTESNDISLLHKERLSDLAFEIEVYRGSPETHESSKPDLTEDEKTTVKGILSLMQTAMDSFEAEERQSRENSCEAPKQHMQKQLDEGHKVDDDADSDEELSNEITNIMFGPQTSQDTTASEWSTISHVSEVDLAPQISSPDSCENCSVLDVATDDSVIVESSSSSACSPSEHIGIARLTCSDDVSPALNIECGQHEYQTVPPDEETTEQTVCPPMAEGQVTKEHTYQHESYPQGRNSQATPTSAQEIFTRTEYTSPDLSVGNTEHASQHESGLSGGISQPIRVPAEQTIHQNEDTPAPSFPAFERSRSVNSSSDFFAAHNMCFFAPDTLRKAPLRVLLKTFRELHRPSARANEPTSPLVFTDAAVDNTDWSTLVSERAEVPKDCQTRESSRRDAAKPMSTCSTFSRLYDTLGWMKTTPGDHCLHPGAFVPADSNKPLWPSARQSCPNPHTIAYLTDPRTLWSVDYRHHNEPQGPVHLNYAPMPRVLVASSVYNGPSSNCYVRLQDGSTQFMGLQDDSQYIRLQDSSSQYMRPQDGGSQYIRLQDGGSQYMRLQDGGSQYIRLQDGSSQYIRLQDSSSQYMRPQDGGSQYIRLQDGGSQYIRLQDGNSQYMGLQDSKNHHMRLQDSRGQHLRLQHGSSQHMRLQDGSRQYMSLQSSNSQYMEQQYSRNQFVDLQDDSNQYKRLQDSRIHSRRFSRAQQEVFADGRADFPTRRNVRAPSCHGRNVALANLSHLAEKFSISTGVRRSSRGVAGACSNPSLEPETVFDAHQEQSTSSRLGRFLIEPNTHVVMSAREQERLLATDNNAAPFSRKGMSQLYRDNTIRRHPSENAFGNETSYRQVQYEHSNGPGHYQSYAPARSRFPEDDGRQRRDTRQHASTTTSQASKSSYFEDDAVLGVILEMGPGFKLPNTSRIRERDQNQDPVPGSPQELVVKAFKSSDSREAPSSSAVSSSFPQATAFDLSAEASPNFVSGAIGGTGAKRESFPAVGGQVTPGAPVAGCVVRVNHETGNAWLQHLPREGTWPSVESMPTVQEFRARCSSAYPLLPPIPTAERSASQGPGMSSVFNVHGAGFLHSALPPSNPVGFGSYLLHQARALAAQQRSGLQTAPPYGDMVVPPPGSGVSFGMAGVEQDFKLPEIPARSKRLDSDSLASTRGMGVPGIPASQNRGYHPYEPLTSPFRKISPPPKLSSLPKVPLIDLPAAPSSFLSLQGTPTTSGFSASVPPPSGVPSGEFYHLPSALLPPMAASSALFRSDGFFVLPSAPRGDTSLVQPSSDSASRQGILWAPNTPNIPYLPSDTSSVKPSSDSAFGQDIPRTPNTPGLSAFIASPSGVPADGLHNLIPDPLVQPSFDLRAQENDEQREEGRPSPVSEAVYNVKVAQWILTQPFGWSFEI